MVLLFIIPLFLDTGYVHNAACNFLELKIELQENLMTSFLVFYAWFLLHVFYLWTVFNTLDIAMLVYVKVTMQKHKSYY